jgi:hypothetical protein
MSKDCHAFNVDEAEKYGVDKAILLQHIRFWTKQNKSKKGCERDGKVWMFQSAQDMAKHYPYWSRQKISRMLRDMEAAGLIISGCYNKTGYDQTKWYTLNLDCSNINNGSLNIEHPIQDTKEDTKKDTLFNECWELFTRKGTKAKAYRYWKSLSEEDKKAIRTIIPKYVRSRERQYFKNFEGWINPANRMWEDEIIEKETERLSI